MIKPVYFSSDNRLLSGVIHYPKQPLIEKVPAIIFVHGFVGSKVGEHRLFVKAAKYFSAQGYLVFRFDFSGCGESEGDYSEVTLTKQIQELQSAIDFVLATELINPNQLTIVGHSLGGAVSSLTASKDHRIHQLILWSPVARPYTDIVRITSYKAVIQANKKGVFDYHGFHLSNAFFEDLKLHDPLTAITTYQGPANIIHAQLDQDVPKENAVDYYRSLSSRKSSALCHYSYIENADHTFSSYAFEQQLFDQTFQWLTGQNRQEKAQII